MSGYTEAIHSLLYRLLTSWLFNCFISLSLRVTLSCLNAAPSFRQHVAKCYVFGPFVNVSDAVLPFRQHATERRVVRPFVDECNAAPSFRQHVAVLHAVGSLLTFTDTVLAYRQLVALHHVSGLLLITR